MPQGSSAAEPARQQQQLAEAYSRAGASGHGDAPNSPKRARAGTHAGAHPSTVEPWLFQFPPEVLCHVLSFLDSRSLAMLLLTTKAFHARDRETRMSLVHQTARSLCVRMQGPELAARWRSYDWLERLRIEESATGFDWQRCYDLGFIFDSADNTATEGQGARLTSISMDGVGPKLLVSDASTADAPLLRWRLRLTGNNAVEFGTVPVSLQDQPKALHKCQLSSSGGRPAGFCSSITMDSMLPTTVHLMRGSVVEVLAWRNRLQFIVTNPPDGLLMMWHKTVKVHKPYKGPAEIRVEQDLDPGEPVKLAVTCWARASFDVLHSVTVPPRAAGREPDAGAAAGANTGSDAVGGSHQQPGQAATQGPSQGSVQGPGQAAQQGAGEGQGHAYVPGPSGGAQSSDGLYYVSGHDPSQGPGFAGPSREHASRGTNQGSDLGSGQGSDQGSGQGSEQGPGPGSDQGSDQEPGHGAAHVSL